MVLYTYFRNTVSNNNDKADGQKYETVHDKEYIDEI